MVAGRICALASGLLSIIPSFAAPSSAYHVQLHYESGMDSKVGILVPGILSCMNIPDPSIKTNDLKLNPVFTNTACSADSRTYHGKESHGLTVYDPPHCDGLFHRKSCPNAGLVTIHIIKDEGKDPVVTCSTSHPALGPQGYEVKCSGPQAPDDGHSNIKFTATVVKSALFPLSQASVPALSAPSSPYHVQLHYETGMEKKVGIIVPGILSCMNIPDPSIKTNDLKLNPVFSNTACSKDGKTYHGKESHGFTVYDPANCDGFFHRKGCPNAGLVTIVIIKEEDKEPVVTCSTRPPALGPQGYEVRCSGPQAPDDGFSNIKFTATIVKSKAAPASLATVPALMAPSSPYHVQLRYETGMETKVGIIVPGILSCMNIPDPSIKTNDLKLNPVFTNTACSKDGKTYHGAESHGLTVYDPPNCDGLFHKKGCPNAGLVTIHISKEEGKDPVVTCSTGPPALGPQGYEVQCSGPQASDDGVSNIKFTATVVKSQQASLMV